MMKLIAAGLALAGFLALTPAQVPPPVLTEMQKARLETALLKMEVAQYRFLEAERARNEAADALQALLATLQRPGYTLDPSTMTYVPRKEKTP